jgi:SAM-dependent methyltransferase
VKEMRELEELTSNRIHPALAVVVQELRLSPNDPILDLGCGTGAWLQRLYGLGFRNLSGIDRNPAQFGAHEWAKFMVADVTEHLSNPGALMQNIGRALKPGGFAIITSPNIYSLRARLRFLLDPRLSYFEDTAASGAHPEHTHPIIIEAYRRNLFDPFSLEVERTWTIPRTDSEGTRPLMRVVAGALRKLLPDPLPGHILCLMLKKK